MSDSAVKKSLFKRWWFWAIAVIIVIAVTRGGNKDNEGTPSPSPGNTQNNTTINNTAVPQNTAPAVTAEGTGTGGKFVSYREGMYKIGADLPAGEYIIISEGFLPAYYQVSSDSSGSLDSIVSNDNFNGNRYITVSEGQYLEIKGSIAYSADNAPALRSADGKYGEGMYKVGRDINAGEYKVTPEEGSIPGYVEVAKDSKGALDSIISNDNFQAEKYITIEDGQYIKLVGCYINTK